jgi:hypothetical protein
VRYAAAAGPVASKILIFLIFGVGTSHVFGAGMITASRGEAKTMSTDRNGHRALAKAFFEQLRESGYSQNQIIDAASELIDLVTHDLKAQAPAPATHSAAELQPSA